MFPVKTAEVIKKVAATERMTITGKQGEVRRQEAIHDAISLNILKNRVAEEGSSVFPNKKLYLCT